jgi:hypothetical protein
MATSKNVTTPGGFFVGLGGIAVFCLVAAFVYNWVRKPAATDEFHAQQVALGLRPAADVRGADADKKHAETAALVAAAAQRYNAGEKPDLDRLDDLRGVIRYREAEKAKADGLKSLTAPIAWKDKAKGEVTMPIDLAMKIVASAIKTRTPKASAVKLDVMPPVDPKAAPSLPNAMGGGVKTVIFADPNAVAPAPAAPPATAPPAAPAPAEPAKPAPAPAGAAAAPPQGQTAQTVAAPNRPPLLNWPESKK